jgi:hypothetical protein
MKAGLLLCCVGLVLGGLPPRADAAPGDKRELAMPPRAAGEHGAAGREVGNQKEGDWTDSRWSQTDVGQFLASNLEVSGAKIAKALTIKVGAGNEGSVCYDTAACALRAGWLGGFLRFDPSRFGLIAAPRITGEIIFSLPAGPGWLGESVRHHGFHPRGKRVVLEYRIGDMRVLDSSWLESTNGLAVLTRSLELAPGPREVRFALATLRDGPVNITPGPDSARAVVTLGATRFVVALLGGGATLLQEKGTLIVSVPKHEAKEELKLMIWRGGEDFLPAFDAFVRTHNARDGLGALVAQTAEARWLPELHTVGQRGLDTDIFAIDTLTIPYENPWKALFFLAGVDFTPDGAAYVCSIHGDVWRVTGIDGPLGALSWKRFATGLFQPLGLKVREGQVFVLGRDQITRLHDQNGDGEADFYESFCNEIDTSTGGHDFVTSLEKDDAGNFYYVDPRGAHRVSADGRRDEILSTGFRNANGLGASPDGKIITVAPQQGEWTPSSEICEVKPGGHFGYRGPKIAPERPLGYDAPLCWIPHSVDNSSGSQVWVPPGQWGPLGGQMLHLLWGRCGLMLVLRDRVGDAAQGAVVPLPGRFLSGPNRGTFSPKDGHLYIAGSTGWQTSAAKDGGLQRVRFTGKPVFLPVGWHAHRNGLSLTFSQPLDRAAAEDPGSYAISQWNYRYASQYGSKDWSVANPDKEGHDTVEIKSARLLPDGKTVFLEIPGVRPVMQLELKYSLNAAGGKPLRNQLWLTLNKLDSARK